MHILNTESNQSISTFINSSLFFLEIWATRAPLQRPQIKILCNTEQNFAKIFRIFGTEDKHPGFNYKTLNKAVSTLKHNTSFTYAVKVYVVGITN